MTPPHHRIDAAPAFIPSNDSAWDTERIDREAAEDGRAAHEHPVLGPYLLGMTRCDLGATVPYRGSQVSPAEYLTGDPDVRIVPRRLPLRWYAEVQDAIDTHRRRSRAAGDPDAPIPLSALLPAVQHGIAGIEGDRVKYIERGGKIAPETERDLFDALGGSAGVWLLGFAIYQYSAPLSPSEKKA